jgi:hypothetical protein
MKDYNANQGTLTGGGVTNEFNKDEYQRERSMIMKDHNGRSLGLHGRHENGLLLNKSNKLDNGESWDKESSKNHLSSSVKGEEYS